MDEELEKLFEYREKVLAELERRVERVKRLEQTEASTQYTLDSEKRTKRVLAGNTGEALAGAAYRARLERELKAIRTELVEARADLTRAQERLEQVDEEIAEKEAANSGSAVESGGSESGASDDGE